jgi:hypothetical protein
LWIKQLFGNPEQLLFLFVQACKTVNCTEYGEANSDQKIGKEIVMENNENFVEQTENVEQTTEQTAQAEKTYTQADVDRMVKEKLDEVMPGKISRIEKKMERKYGNLISTLEAGTGKKGVEELDDTFRGFYTGKGVNVPPKQSEYSGKDDEYLAERYVSEIISEGEAEEEFARLEALGAKMNKREQAAFKILAERLQDAKNYGELAQIGVTKEEYNSEEYQKFRRQFTPEIPETTRYKMYQQNQPKKEVKSMGSMKSNVPQNNGVKDFYSFEEAQKFSKADFDKNPALYAAVCKSMTKW